ncbi:NAD(P)/FAD-dependent oxidoreductase [Clostridium formicaceticum]|uniref:Hydrogen cyanide synthase subunit HcnB n=1 Tax=Clostridium formicaceticum TaxID=1497 RepID=A0AAC9WGX6_9CLOT|nr:FAD/NAD(P)-binding oxidoreductase [Clostridium formicaceticum]AOY77864.1 pyridine nucleotide-disulfide oxidoreductase [Clostridium formicaceticum]ARE88482.1 Hydrogen cyanide synthase subunit HcnB [Clostridium formicaceticum]
MIKKEVVVIGGGPAGLAAAIEAAKRGVQVLVIDANAEAGGQLIKQIHKFFGSSAHRAGIRGMDIGSQLLQEAKDYGVEIWLNSVVIGLSKEKTMAVETGTDDIDKKVKLIEAEKIVIATGGSENVVRFKGWTLPGVMGAGAAQTMINSNRVKPGKKVVMIGSGNVGLIVSYQLLQGGVDVVALVEAAPNIGGYAVHASKITRAGVPIYTRHTILEAKGKDRVTEAVICEVDDKWQPIEGTEKVVKVDTIAIAAGLKPLAELAIMHDCQTKFDTVLGGWIPLHNTNMESTYPGIYVVGDITGIEEANTALEEGRLAGVAIAEALGKIEPIEAEKLKGEIWERLDGLRSGPDGEVRMKAKSRQMESFKELVNV